VIPPLPDPADYPDDPACEGRRLTADEIRRTEAVWTAWLHITSPSPRKAPDVRYDPLDNLRPHGDVGKLAEHRTMKAVITRALANGKGPHYDTARPAKEGI
jgi:hypothetical protein